MAKARHGLYSKTTGRLAGTDRLGGSPLRRGNTRVREAVTTPPPVTPAIELRRYIFRLCQIVHSSGTSNDLWQGFRGSSNALKSSPSAMSWLLSLVDVHPTAGIRWGFFPHPFRLGPISISKYSRILPTGSGTATCFGPSSLPGQNSDWDDKLCMMLCLQYDPLSPVFISSGLSREQTKGGWHTITGLTPGTSYRSFVWYYGRRSDGRMAYSEMLSTLVNVT